MKLPREIVEQFRAFGSAGGRARARSLSRAERQRIARVASMARWTRERFGAACFAELGLPGGDLVDTGLADAAGEVQSLEALLVAIAAPRLRREGVPVPATVAADPYLRCYRLLEERHGEMAYARYLAFLGQLRSFADSCHLVRMRRRIARERPGRSPGEGHA